MMPTNTPTAEQRNTSQKWRKVSLMPSMTPRLKFSAGRSPAMEVPRTAKSIDLRNREDTHQHRHQIESFPEIHQTHVESQGARLALLADGRKQETEQPHGEAVDLPAHAQAAERGDAGDADDREHEQFRRAEGQHQRAHDRNRQREGDRADQRADAESSSAPRRARGRLRRFSPSGNRRRPWPRKVPRPARRKGSR